VRGAVVVGDGGDAVGDVQLADRKPRKLPIRDRGAAGKGEQRPIRRPNSPAVQPCDGSNRINMST